MTKIKSTDNYKKIWNTTAQTIIGIIVWLYSCSCLHAQQQWVEGSDSRWFELEDYGASDFYPGMVTISGGQPYVVGVTVEFPKIFLNTTLAEYDFLLESPSGRKVMLFSDWDETLWGFVAGEFRVSAFANQSQDSWDVQNAVLPHNFESDLDSFPLPGPGKMLPGKATFADFANENPNGTWKLWMVDDTDNDSYLSLAQGWTLHILTSPAPVCPQPDLPVVSNITDSTAVIDWKGYASGDRWDIFWQLSNNLPPDENTQPMVENWPNEQFLLENLTPDDSFHVFVRSVCTDGTRSFWMRPVQFRTLFTPCEHTIPISVCQKVDCADYPDYWIAPFQAGCANLARQWVFRFVPPETGPYWLSYDGFDSFAYTNLNWLADTLPTCPTDGWHCLAQQPSSPPHQLLDTLWAGIPYILMFQNYSVPPRFKLSHCLTPELVISQVPQTLEPHRATLRFGGANSTTPLELDLFYTDDSTATEPGIQTQPTETGILTDPATDHQYRLSGQALNASANYRLWYRVPCHPDSTRSCWVGPFWFKTGTDCGAYQTVWFDSITDNSVIVHFLAPKAGSTTDFEVKVNGIFVNTPPTVFYADSTGQHFQFKLIGLDPETSHELRLKAICYPDGLDNPWFSFFFTTRPGCFMPLEDIQCGIIKKGLRFDTLPNLLETITCPYPISGYSIGEHLLRFTATQTGIVTVYKLENSSMPLGWYYKEASLGCNKSGFKPMDCSSSFFDEATFPADSGKTYLILLDGFKANSDIGPYTIDVLIWNCAPDCPVVDSFGIEEKTTTSVSLRWQNVAPGAIYEIHAQPFLASGPETVLTTTDTTIVISDLGASLEYSVWINTLCPGGQPNPGNSKIINLGENPQKRPFSFGRCSPRYVPSGKNYTSPYEVFEIEVPQTGEYLFRSQDKEMYFYDSLFLPENPTQHLLASVVKHKPFGMDTMLTLESGKQYLCVLSDRQSVTYTTFNIPGSNYADIFMDGPAPPLRLEARWNGLTPDVRGKVPYHGQWYHSGVCADTAGWIHYYKIADDPLDYAGDYLLLSIKTNVAPATMNALPLVFSSSDGPVKITAPPAVYFNNPDGIYEMNRVWLMQNLAPSQQIDQDFLIRFYYTQQEYEQLKTVIESEGGSLDSHEDMYFYKINGFHSLYNVAPPHPFVYAATAYDTTGYWPYANHSEASPTTWRHGTYGDQHYGEMVIHGFSGGGGGATVNGRSVFDVTSKTNETGQTLKLQVFPNPNSGEFTVKLPEIANSGLRLRVQNLTGQILHEQEAQTGTMYQTIRLSQLPAGLYLLQVISERQVLATEWFVKE